MRRSRRRPRRPSHRQRRAASSSRGDRGAVAALRLRGDRQPQSSQRTTIWPLRPGRGRDSASASTAWRSAVERRRHVWIATTAFARRHVPTTSPPTSTAPGQTRGVHSSRRRFSSGTRSSRSTPWSRKYVSPLGRSRAGAAGEALGPEARLVAGQDPLIADRRSHGHDLPRERFERRAALSRTDPGPLGEGCGRGRPEDMHVPARELQSSLTWIDLGPRNGPDHRPSCALPTHQDGACRCGIAQRIGMDAYPSPGLVVPHPSAIEERVQASGGVLGATQALGVGGQATEREDRSITRGDDVRAEPRPPHLDERRVLPGRRLGPRDAGVDRENCGARHAVLQAGPRCALERGSARRQPLVERSRPASVRQYLRP